MTTKTAGISSSGWQISSKKPRLNVTFTPWNAIAYSTGAWAFIPNPARLARPPRSAWQEGGPEGAQARDGGLGKGDARILGSGEFVSATLQQSETDLVKKYLPKRPIEELIEAVAEKLGVKSELICSGNKQSRYSKARSLVAFLAVEEIGHPAAEVARYLGITRMGVQKAVMTCPPIAYRWFCSLKNSHISQVSFDAFYVG